MLTNDKLLVLSLLLFSACSSEGNKVEPTATPLAVQVEGKTRVIEDLGIKKIFVVVLENASFSETTGLPFQSRLGEKGALLKNFTAVARPSQPNYFVMVAGSTFNVVTNDNVDLNEAHLGDLLESENKTWKLYAEGYPGRCFLKPTYGHYSRKHVPFLSFTNVTKNKKRCSRVVEAQQFLIDYRSEKLSDFSLYIPNNLNNGHDTGWAYADRWLEKTFGHLLDDPKFMKDMLFVVTYDEGGSSNQHIATYFYGSSVMPGSSSDEPYGHQHLLRTIQEIFSLKSLGRGDASATAIQGIWN